MTPEPDEPDDMTGDEMVMEIECPYCDGTGEIVFDVTPSGRLMTDCPECGGTGWC